MDEPLETSSSTPSSATDIYNDDMDSACSTPYVSAPSSPGRGGSVGHYYYSAPASPMHFLLSTASHHSSSSSAPASDDFDFSAPTGGGSATSGPMSSADELFFNGQIRPMRLSSHLQRPQMLAPLIDGDENDDDAASDNVRGRDMKLRNKSLRRRTRSMSPLRSTASFDWQEEDFVAEDDRVEGSGNGESVGEEGKIGEDVKSKETTTCDSGASSRSSSVGRSSKRWVLLKEFLYRSKSEGRNNGHNFWGNLPFSPVLKDKKVEKVEKSEEKLKIPKVKDNSGGGSEQMKKKRTLCLKVENI